MLVACNTASGKGDDTLPSSDALRETWKAGTEPVALQQANGNTKKLTPHP